MKGSWMLLDVASHFNVVSQITTKTTAPIKPSCSRMFVLHKSGADLSGYFIRCFLSRRVTGEPCVHVRSDWELRVLWNIKIRAVNRVFVMDPESLVEALRGTMDPNLREAAERQLNEVKLDGNGDGSCGAVSTRGLGRSQHQDGAITQTGIFCRYLDLSSDKPRHSIRVTHLGLTTPLISPRQRRWREFSKILIPMTLVCQLPTSTLASSWASCVANANQANASRMLKRSLLANLTQLP